MFGDRYFALRERLTGVMAGIAALASETGTDLAEILPLAQARKELGAPFLFLACGEVNAGKSTLFNGLFGQPLCKANVLPETQRLLWYRHGPARRDVELTPLLHECYRPAEFLRDFHLLDTPGTNAKIDGHLELLVRLLPAADLILVVFPIANPWGASAWDFIARIPPQSLDRLVLIVQQSDLRDPADLPVILGHMRDLSRKRIGQVPRILALSGKLALEAKSASPPAGAALRASGYPELESFISRFVCESPPRKAALEHWRARSATALRHIEDRIEEQTRALGRQGRFLETVEREIDGLRERFVLRLPRHLTGVAEVFRTEAAGVSKVLGARLGAARSIYRLFVGDRTGQRMEALFVERLQAAVEAVAEQDGAEVVEACRAHEALLGGRIHEALGVELASPHPIDQTLATSRQRFVKRLGRSARQGIGDLKVRHQLDKDLRRRNLALKSFTFTTLLLLTAAGLCGALALPLLPGLLGAAAALFLAGGVLTAWITRKAIVADFRERLLDTCGSFASTLQDDYEEALRIVFQDYTDTLDTVRSHLAGEKLAVEPRLRRWQELFLTLKAIEQDL